MIKPKITDIVFLEDMLQLSSMIDIFHITSLLLRNVHSSSISNWSSTFFLNDLMENRLKRIAIKITGISR